MTRKRYNITKEFLQKEFKEKGRSPQELADEIGCSRRTIRNYLLQYGFESRPMGRTKVKRIGQRSGKLLIKKAVGQDHRSNTLWECVCDCGNTHILPNQQFNKILSCGCSKITPGHRSVPGYFYTRIKDRANVRGIPLKVTVDDIGELLEKQDFKCALTGWPIYVAKKSGQRSSASLDRIDSSKGYVKGNLQWVHKEVNRMKWHLSMKRFVEICEAVTKTASVS